MELFPHTTNATRGAEPPKGLPPLRQRRLAQMRELPPDLTIMQVARRLAVGRMTARYWIDEAGYKVGWAPGRGLGNLKITPQQWHRVDWSLRDGSIAKILGVSRERVRQVRLRDGKPMTHPPRRSLAEHLETIRRLPKNLTVNQVADRLGVGYHYASGLATAAGYSCRLLKPGCR